MSVLFLGGDSSPTSPISLENLLAWSLDGTEPYYSTTSLDNYQLLKSIEPYGSYRAPRQGRVWDFDGVDDIAESTFTLQSVATDPFTVSVFFKTTIGVAQSLVGVVATSTIRQVNITAVGDTDFRLGGTTIGANRVIFSTGFASDVWNHIALVWDGAAVSCYRNGIFFSTFALSSPGDWVGLPVILGSARTPSIFTPFSGILRDARFYNVVKDATAIANIYAGGTDTTGLLAQYPCNEEAETTGYDVSGNGRHLTLKNITPSTFHAIDTGVTSNLNNELGYRLSGSTYIPSLLSGASAADGNALTQTGQSPYPVTVETPCITGDGTNVYVNAGSALFPATEDYEAEIYYYHVTNDDSRRVIVSQSGTTVRLQANSSSSISTALAGGLTWSEGNVGAGVHIATALVAGSWHKINWGRSGDTFTLTCEQLLTGVINTATTVGADTTGTTTDTSFLSLGVNATARNNGRVASFSITTAGVTTYFPLQEGVERDVYFVKSDNTYGIVSSAIIGGTEADIWANRVPGYAQDWCVEYGGRVNSQNLLTHSEQFDDSTWIKSSLITVAADSIAAPDGTLTADTINILEGTATKHIRQAQATDVDHVFSVYAKAGTYHQIQLIRDGGSTRFANFDLATGTIGTVGAPVTATMTNVGNGWYRCSIALELFSVSSATARVYAVDSDSSLFATATSATGNFYLWGAQVNNGTIVANYERTTASAVLVGGVFVPGLIGSSNAADGNAKTLVAGKFGNPYSRLNANPFSAAEYNGRSIPTAYAPAGSWNSVITPSNSAFRRTKPDGDDRLIIYETTQTGAALSKAQTYTS